MAKKRGTGPFVQAEIFSFRTFLLLQVGAEGDHVHGSCDCVLCGASLSHTSPYSFLLMTDPAAGMLFAILLTGAASPAGSATWSDLRLLW